MNYPSSLTSAQQWDETSKEAGDNSMTAKPMCGDPDISKSHRRGEEHMAKATLPESQIETGGSHSPLTPDTGRLPDAACSARLCMSKQSRDGAGSKPDNGRTGRLRARDHHFLCTTGSPNRELAPAWRRSLRSTQGAGSTPGAVGPRAGRARVLTVDASAERSSRRGGREAVGNPRRTLERRPTNVDR